MHPKRFMMSKSAALFLNGTVLVSASLQLWLWFNISENLSAIIIEKISKLGQSLLILQIVTNLTLWNIRSLQMQLRFCMLHHICSAFPRYQYENDTSLDKTCKQVGFPKLHDPHKLTYTRSVLSQTVPHCWRQATLCALEIGLSVMLFNFSDV